MQNYSKKLEANTMHPWSRGNGRSMESCKGPQSNSVETISLKKSHGSTVGISGFGIRCEKVLRLSCKCSDVTCCRVFRGGDRAVFDVTIPQLPQSTQGGRRCRSAACSPVPVVCCGSRKPLGLTLEAFPDGRGQAMGAFRPALAFFQAQGWASAASPKKATRTSSTGAP